MTLSQIQTARLLVRRFQEGDLPCSSEYYLEPEVARYRAGDWISLARAQSIVPEQKLIEPAVPVLWLKFAFEPMGRANWWATAGCAC